MEILKEDSRDMASQYKLYYDGDSEKITILEAKTNRKLVRGSMAYRIRS